MPVFGATNQVLAALTLLLCALYLKRLGKKTRTYMIPAVFILFITFAAMGIQVVRDLSSGLWLVGGVGCFIAILTLWVTIEAWFAWRQSSATYLDS